MTDDQDNKKSRRSPEEELRLFHAPQEHPSTRREVLGSLLGAFALGCGNSVVADSGAPSGGGSLGETGGTGGLAEATGGNEGTGGTGEDEPTVRSAYDLVELGSTGIKTSRLAMGTGTDGYGGSSMQTRMGADFTRMLVQGYERGIRFFETADAYGSHRLVGDAMRQVGRQDVTVLTKTMAETKEDAEADLARFLDELGTDYIDIVLLHIRTSPTWTTESAGAMEALAEAKARGQIRAHGVSCHSLEALRLARQTDWVDLDLARVNPFGVRMDADPATVIPELRSMKAGGKGVLGMKIFGGGENVEQFDEAIEHATRLDAIHGFTIGFTSLEQLDEVADKMTRV